MSEIYTVEEEDFMGREGVFLRRFANLKPRNLKSTCSVCGGGLVFQNRVEFVKTVQDPVYGGSGSRPLRIYREIPEIHCRQCFMLYSIHLLEVEERFVGPIFMSPEKQAFLRYVEDHGHFVQG